MIMIWKTTKALRHEGEEGQGKREWEEERNLPSLFSLPPFLLLVP